MKVPKLWLGDTDSILFVCKIHRTYMIRMEEMSITNDDLTKHSQYLEQEQLMYKENIKEFKNEIQNLKRVMPKKALQHYEMQYGKGSSEQAGEGKGSNSNCTIC